MSTTLTLDGVQVHRGGRALTEPVSVTLTGGDVLGIVGPNGAGKSSLLAAIAHLDIVRTGAITLDGADPARLSAKARARLVSMLAQDTWAPPELTVAEVVGIGARAGGHRRPARAVAEALGLLGLTDLAHRRLGTLSGGQRQLVQFARVLAQDTPVALLDEPTAALDLAYQRTIERTMRATAQRGRIVIAALHDLSLALNACTHLILIDARGGVHVGPPSDVLDPDRVLAAYGVHSSILTTMHGRSVLATHDPHLGDPS